MLLIIQWVGSGSARLISLKISWACSIEGFVLEGGLLYLLILLEQWLSGAYPSQSEGQKGKSESQTIRAHIPTLTMLANTPLAKASHRVTSKLSGVANFTPLTEGSHKKGEKQRIDFKRAIQFCPLGHNGLFPFYLKNTFVTSPNHQKISPIMAIPTYGDVVRISENKYKATNTQLRA